MAGSRPKDPYRGFRFRLELGHIQVAGFSECSGLESEVGVEEVEEGGRNTHTLKFPKAGKMSNITLKHGLYDSVDLWKWHQSVLTGNFDHANQRPPDVNEDSSKQCTIVLMDEKGEDVKRWKIKRALPIKWTGPELKATDDGIVFETIVLAHEGLELS